MLTKDTDKKLFLLDAYALIFRAYFAFSKNPRINSKGFNTSAVFGFTNSLIDILKNEKPSHIAVAFDPPTKLVRAEEYEAYKANRDETPEDIKLSVPYIMRILEAFNIPAIIFNGYEADDVIGTLAYKAADEGFTTYMMTPDKDFGQLVRERILMYKPSRMGNAAEIWGIKEVCEKFEVEDPKQVIDILGLWGDAVDNIPGVPGIGEKTAKKLIKQYGSIEGIYEHLDELKGKLKENLINFKEQAFLSKKLATIITDLDIDLDPVSLTLNDPDEKKLKEVFDELEFRRLAERVFGMYADKPAVPGGQMSLFGPAPEPGNEPDTIENTDHNYRLVDEKGIDLLVRDLGKAKTLCFDTETTSLDSLKAKLVGISFSKKAGEAFYVPFPDDFDKAKALANKLRPLFENEKIEKAGHNLKYDMKVLHKYGITVKGPLFDTMIAHYLLHPDNNRRSMDVLAENILGYKPVSITELIGKKGKNQRSMRDVEPAVVSDYACEDADITFRLMEHFRPELKKDREDDIFRNIEMPLVPVLARMEIEGIRLDSNLLHRISDELQKDILEIENRIYEMAGMHFNIASPRQVGEVLFDKLKIDAKPKKTKTGQYATSEDVLQKLRDKHPIVAALLDYRELVKLKNTYVDTLPLLADPDTGRIHTTFNQVVAATGRLSSDKPNLQNIPVRTERGREIRKAFIPRNEDYVILSADYSQIELRIIAALSKDEGMLEAFRQGQDIHASTAAKVYGVPLEEVTREMRSHAKMVNFGIIYGISAFGLAQRLGISRTEAKHIIDSYFEKFPGIKAYMEKSIEFAREHGYVQTIMGRKRYLRDINSANAVVRGFAERNAINSPIQGSAADMIKIAMIRVDDYLRKNSFKTKMVLQVHDELVFDAAKDEVAVILPEIKEMMSSAIDLDVPVVVDANTGANWLDAH